MFQNSFNATIHDDIKVKLTGVLNGAILFNDNGILKSVNPSQGSLYWNGTTFSWITSLSPSGNAGGVLNGQYPNPGLATNAVNFSHLQNINSARLLGRVSAGSGVVEQLSSAQIATLLGLGTSAYRSVGTSVGNVVEVIAGGTIDPALVPAVAIGNFTTVASNAAKQALSGSSIRAGETTVRVLVDETRGNKASTYGLMALPASTESNWVLLSDEQVDAGDIVSGAIAPARLGSNSGNSQTFLNGLGNFVSVPSGTKPISVITDNTQLAVNQRYVTNSATLLSLNLPTVATVGDSIQVLGYGLGGWRVTQNDSQSIRYLSSNSTTGVTGNIETEIAQTNSYASSIELVCVATNNSWLVTSSMGVFSII